MNVLYVLVLGLTATKAIFIVALAISVIINLLLKDKEKELQKRLKEEKDQVQYWKSKCKEEEQSVINLQTSAKRLENKFRASRSILIHIARNPIGCLRYVGEGKTPNIRLAKSKEKERVFESYAQFGKEQLDDKLKIFVGENTPNDENEIDLATMVTRIDIL